MMPNPKDKDGNVISSAASSTGWWIACHEETSEPIRANGNLGTYVPVWNNPMSAHEWAQANSKVKKYFVREIEMLFLARRDNY
jgi:hypothetical protein